MVYTVMKTSSALVNGLLDYLGEEPSLAPDRNMATLHHQGQRAQWWLVSNYLASWLALIGDLTDREYPVAKRFRVQLRALARLSTYLDPSDPESNQITELRSIEANLQSTLRVMAGYPSERDMQWGIWARDVPMSIAHALAETEFLDPLICEGIAPCCMYAAFLVSRVVDDGAAKEISSRMFEEKPRELIELMDSVPVSPEA